MLVGSVCFSCPHRISYDQGQESVCKDNQTYTHVSEKMWESLRTARVTRIRQGDQEDTEKSPRGVAYKQVFGGLWPIWSGELVYILCGL